MEHVKGLQRSAELDQVGYAAEQWQQNAIRQHGGQFKYDGGIVVKSTQRKRNKTAGDITR